MTPYLTAAVGGLVMILITLVSWIGANMISKIDRLDEKTTEQHVSTMGTISKLEGRVANLEYRIGQLEKREKAQ